MSWENGFPAHIFSRDYPRFLLSIIIENEKILMYSNGCICQSSNGEKLFVLDKGLKYYITNSGLGNKSI